MKHLLNKLLLWKKFQLTDRVPIKDNKRNRIGEVILRSGELRCLLDEKIDCVYVGFVYSLPEVYIVLKNKEMKAPKSLH
jgi:hypothetical protein